MINNGIIIQKASRIFLRLNAEILNDLAIEKRINIVCKSFDFKTQFFIKYKLNERVCIYIYVYATQYYRIFSISTAGFEFTIND